MCLFFFKSLLWNCVCQDIIFFLHKYINIDENSGRFSPIPLSAVYLNSGALFNQKKKYIFNFSILHLTHRKQ